MKQLFFLFMSIFAISASAQINISEGFEGYSGTNYPPGWSGSTNTSATSPNIIPDDACMGSKYIASLMIPALGVTSMSVIYSSMQSSGQAINVSFKYNTKVASSSYVVGGYMNVEYTKDGGVSWQSIAGTVTLVDTNGICSDFLGTIPAGTIPVDADFKLRISTALKNNSGTYAFRIGIDNVVLSQLGNCYPPSSVIASNISNNSANITWQAPSAAPLSYDMYYSTVATNPLSTTTPTISNIPTVSQSLSTGLSPNTVYYVWVRSVCSTDKSAWSLAGTFKTLCDPIGNFTENFDTYPTGSIVPTCWDRIIGGTGSQTITSITPASGTRNISQYSTASPSNQTIVILPLLNNINAGTNWLKFKAKVSNAATPGNLEVGYVTNYTNASSFVSLQSFTITNDTYNSSSERTVIVPNTVPPNARLAVRNPAISNANIYWDDFVWEAYSTMNTNEAADKEMNIEVFPNPFHDILNISNINKLSNITISDASGRLIKKYQKPQNVLKLNDLMVGVYFVNLYFQDGSDKTIKIIKK